MASMAVFGFICILDESSSKNMVRPDPLLGIEICWSLDICGKRCPSYLMIRC